MIEWLRRRLCPKQGESGWREIKGLKYTPLPVAPDSWSVIELSPGDVIVLSTEHVLGNPMVTRLREEFKANLPDHMHNHKILVLQGGLKLNVLKETKND